MAGLDPAMVRSVRTLCQHSESLCHVKSRHMKLKVTASLRGGVGSNRMRKISLQDNEPIRRWQDETAGHAQVAKKSECASIRSIFCETKPIFPFGTIGFA